MGVDLKFIVLAAFLVVLLVGISEVSGIRRARTVRTIRTVRSTITARSVRTARAARKTVTSRPITRRTIAPVTRRTIAPITRRTIAPITRRTIAPVTRRSITRNPIIRATTRPTILRRNTTPRQFYRTRQPYRTTSSWINPARRTSTRRTNYPYGGQGSRTTSSWKDYFFRSTTYLIYGKSTRKTESHGSGWPPSNFKTSKQSVKCLRMCQERDSCRSVNQCYRLYKCPETCGGSRLGVSWITKVVAFAFPSMILKVFN